MMSRRARECFITTLYRRGDTARRFEHPCGDMSIDRVVIHHENSHSLQRKGASVRLVSWWRALARGLEHPSDEPQSASSVALFPGRKIKRSGPCGNCSPRYSRTASKTPS